MSEYVEQVGLLQHYVLLYADSKIIKPYEVNENDFIDNLKSRATPVPELISGFWGGEQNVRRLLHKIKRYEADREAFHGN